MKTAKTRFAAATLMFVLGALPALGDGLIIVHEPIRPAPWPRPPGPMPPPRHYAFAPLEIVFHHVEARVRDQLARTEVDQEFYNPNDRQLEGTYIFPVPKGAQLDKFSMEVGGKQMEAELLPADKARQIYEDIVRRMKDPALLEYAGRDVFKVRIFPIEPRSKKRVKLAYTQLLKGDGGLYNYLYPLNTERFSARPIQTVSMKLELETRRPLKSIYSPSHAVEIRRQGPNRAVVGFELKDARPDTDFQLFYSPEGGDVGMNLLTYKTGGEDGYFALLAAPGYETDARKVVAKDVAFVLDSSGSMAGAKLEQAKKALLFCIENLNDGDRFDIIRFSTDAETAFGQLTGASRAQRDRATEFVRDIKPTGGTAIHDALRKALATRPGNSDRPYLVIFLTDGQPTVGETNPDRIVDAVSQPGGGNTRIFCFGIGNDVNTHLLDRITETTHASSAYVLPTEDIEVKVSGFFAKVKEPVLAGVKLTFPEGARVGKLYPSALPDLFRGEQLVLVGRYAGQASGKILLEGNVNGVAQKFTEEARFAGSATEHDFIPRLWATRRIGYLLDEIRLRGENAEVRDEITELARKYGIVTPYTAYLIHEDENRRAVPLAQQSLRMLNDNALALNVMRDAYKEATRETSGAAAVAGARYGLSQKGANQVDAALADGRSEAQAPMATMMLRYQSAPAAAGVPVNAAPGAPAQVLTRPRPSAPARPARVAPAELATQIAQATQQSRFVGGRNFFQNGSQWTDSEVQKLKNPSTVRVQFGSNEYFDLVAKNPTIQPWLALGSNLQFALAGKVYEIYE